jgi:hypothetical protein
MEDFAEPAGIHNASGIPASRRGYAAQSASGPDGTLRPEYQAWIAFVHPVPAHVTVPQKRGCWEPLGTPIHQKFGFRASDSAATVDTRWRG